MLPLHTTRVVGRFRSTILLAFFLFGVQLIFAQIPTGYYTSAVGTGATLKTALYNIIKGHTVKSYDYIWTAYYTTDVRSDGKVWDMYSDIPGGTPPYEFTLGSGQCGSGGVSAEGQCYSREHSFPKSWFGGEVSPMYTDIFHIYPTDQYVNNRRSDNPYGKVNSPTWTSLNGSKVGPCVTPGFTGTVFEPRDDFKGDFARTYFYMATRYENVIATWQNNNPGGAAILDGTSYPVYQTWYLNMLLEWNAQDPVSQKEIDRNNAVYAIQNNRNPFIDHPEYALAIWVPGIPTTTTLAATNVTASGATLNGTVNPNGVATNYHFEWGTTPGYGNSTTTTSAGSGSGNVSVNAGITSLASGTIYHYRLVAVNSNGTSNGNDLTLTTLTPTLTVSPTDRPVPAPSGNTSFAVTSNSNWTASSNQTWCTVTPSGSGNGTITATYSTNSTIVLRVANITVTVSGLSPIVVTVTQSGSASTLSVTPSDRLVTALPGNTSFTVTSNANWTASSNQIWCTVTPSGSGNGTITATYSINSTIVQRVANVTVTVTGLTPVIVTVTQAGVALPPEPTNFPTNFSAFNIILHWTDATGAVVPTGYLVRMSSMDFSAIPIPVDGIPVPTGASDKNVLSGVQEAWFGNLTPNTTYYFKIFGYQGSGSSIDYKTDGAVPQVQKTTQP